MMNKGIAEFEKVSFEQYKEARLKCLGVAEADDELLALIHDEWNHIELPQRATAGSAGYDFRVPMPVDIGTESKLIPTGIRCYIDNTHVLMMFPRSGFGMKYGMRLDNTVGIIDSDYYYADNEGHIMAKVHADKEVHLNSGERFCQGVFVPFGIAQFDDTSAKRTGGMGSTGKN